MTAASYGVEMNSWQTKHGEIMARALAWGLNQMINLWSTATIRDKISMDPRNLYVQPTVPKVVSIYATLPIRIATVQHQHANARLVSLAAIAKLTFALLQDAENTAAALPYI